MDAGGDLSSVAKKDRLRIGLEVAGSGPVQLPFFHSLLFTMCSYLACLSFGYTMVCRPSSLIIKSEQCYAESTHWCVQSHMYMHCYHFAHTHVCFPMVPNIPFPFHSHFSSCAADRSRNCSVSLPKHVLHLSCLCSCKC